MRPSLDSLVHQLLVVAVTMVVPDAAVSVADLAVVWELVVVAVKSTSPTFVLSSPSFLLSFWVRN